MVLGERGRQRRDDNKQQDLELEANKQKSQTDEFEQDGNANVNYAQDFQQFNIAYEEITDKQEIGKGRFGVVYQAYWHGAIAIKEIDSKRCKIK